MGLRPLMTKPAETWAAEHKANRTLAEQEIWEAGQEHRCGRCYGPYGKSAIRCSNEPGGK